MRSFQMDVEGPTNEVLLLLAIGEVCMRMRGTKGIPAGRQQQNRASLLLLLLLRREGGSGS